MKKVTAWILLLAMLLLPGCGKTPETVENVTTDYLTYERLSDGTFRAGDVVYQHRLEITGTMPNTNTQVTFVYLTNLENITFDQAVKASGVGSNTDDYFSPDQAVLVDWITAE